MLYYLNTYSKSRKYWILLTATTIVLELISLYLQHKFLLPPCVLCIYQRCALIGITLSGMIAIIAPTIKPIRILAIYIWIYSSWKGILLAQKHINIQLYPSPFLTCDLFVKFPDWFPLDKWFPNIFFAYGNCSEDTWHFLSLEISQWMFLIFSVYLFIGLITCISQITNISTNKMQSK